MRLKSSANPLVIGVRHGVRAPKSSVGQKLSEVVLRKSALTFDLDARFDLKGGGTVDLRIVGRRDPKTREVHWSVTNLSPADFEVESLATLYRLRWIVELLFKVLKSPCHLGYLDTTDPHALRTFIYASLLMALVITALVEAGTARARIHPSEVSIRTLGRALPLIAVPLLLLWLRRKLTYDELAARIFRVVAIGYRDQNPRRTRAYWRAPDGSHMAMNGYSKVFPPEPLPDHGTGSTAAKQRRLESSDPDGMMSRWRYRSSRPNVVSRTTKGPCRRTVTGVPASIPPENSPQCGPEEKENATSRFR
jgi:hypothetical protein